MPRKARKKSSTGIYHVVLRGVNRQCIFIDDADRIKFLSKLLYFKELTGCEIFCYCLMDNHIHLLIKIDGELLATFIKQICGSYVFYFNDKYGRCGHLFQERFRSETVENDCYFFIALRYILQNPVKAGLTKRAAEYRWSSYKDYLISSKVSEVEWVLEMFSSDKKLAVKLFVEYVNTPNEDECLDYESKHRVPDKDVIEYIKRISGREASELINLEKRERDAIIKKVKSMQGVSLRQIERVTGIPKSTIDRL